MAIAQPDAREVLDPADIAPNIDHIVTEDDTPVDNIFSEKQQRLLTEPLYSSWSGPGAERVFMAAANVGVFAAVSQLPLVPDVFLSLDVRVPEDMWAKNHRSYFLWEYGKPPDAVIEIVSNRKGNEAGSKIRDYARIGVTYYAIFDPDEQLQGKILRLYALREGKYAPLKGQWLPEIGLGLTLWRGMFEGTDATWLRWCDHDGNVIATGAERAEQERERAEQERERAEQERERAERLAARLRELGVDPEGI
jgi:Uma2 family endonuclease